MPDVPILWASGARKEAMDLLRRLWTRGDEQARLALSAAIVAGPPEQLLAHIDPDDRTTSRDRRIFDRLTVIERVREPPLDQALAAEWARLRATYPDWRSVEGEQAHFSTWMETRIGSDSNYGPEELKGMTVPRLTALLLGEQEKRDGLMDAWRQVGISDPVLTITVLESLSERQAPEPTDVWVYGLWGVRDSATEAAEKQRLLNLLLVLPDASFRHPEIANAVADILEGLAKVRPLPVDEACFWRLFDRTLPAAAADPANREIPEDRGWVFLAINRSMGTLATAFFGVLFGRELKVGEGIPTDLKPRLDELLSPFVEEHRPARVIAASRLSYLFAVDPDWSTEQLLPSFDWAQEDEAIAAWQGFAWQPRIDAKLWGALKPHFLPMFTPERLHQLGAGGKNMAAMLMLVGVEFGPNELPRDGVRDAIRAMPDEFRIEAAAWIASYLRQPADGDDPPEVAADQLWTDRVAPWLQKVWPPEPQIRSRGTAVQFARAAVAVGEHFPRAVTLLTPQFIRGAADMALMDLAASTHPDRHPRATLELLEATLDLNQFWFADELRRILNRVRAADGTVTDTVSYRQLDQRLRVDGR